MNTSVCTLVAYVCMERNNSHQAGDEGWDRH